MPPPDALAPQPIQSPQNGWRYAGLLELLTTVVLLGGPIFYVLGRIYSESYWLALGISPSVMSIAAEDYIYYGFVVVATGLTMILPRGDSWAVWSVPLAALVLLALLSSLFWLLRKAKEAVALRLRKHRRRLRLYLTKGKPVLESTDRAATVIAVLSTLSLALLMLSAALLLPIVVAHEVGKARASKVLGELASPKTPFGPVRVDGAAAGRLVECTAKYCVIYDKGKLWPVPVESVRWDTAR